MNEIEVNENHGLFHSYINKIEQDPFFQPKDQPVNTKEGKI